jgi:Protein of unknown function (DUF3037)
MAGSCNVEYFFLLYVPNVVSGESIAIAAILIDSTDLENGICTMSFAADWQARVRVFDPDSDLEMLRALLTEIKDRLLSRDERAEMIRQMEDSFSNVIQVSQRRKCPVAPSPETFEAFARELLGNTFKSPLGSSGVQALTCEATVERVGFCDAKGSYSRAL